MNGSETLMVACSLANSFQACGPRRSRLRLRSAARWLGRCRAGLSLLIALAALALAAVLAILALTFPGLTFLGLAVLALPALGISLGISLGIGAAAALARREVGGRRPSIGADQNFGAVGQVSKARGHDAIRRREPARDHGVVFVLLRHHDRLRGRDIVWADHVAERTDRAELDRRRRHHDRLLDRFDLQPHIDELSGPELEFCIRKFGLQLQRAGGR